MNEAPISMTIAFARLPLGKWEYCARRANEGSSFDQMKALTFKK